LDFDAEGRGKMEKREDELASRGIWDEHEVGPLYSTGPASCQSQNEGDTTNADWERGEWVGAPGPGPATAGNIPELRTEQNIRSRKEPRIMKGVNKGIKMRLIAQAQQC